MPPPAAASTGLTITNPLVLYRALLATKRIEPDPSQHRLAIHLQKLYHRLKDYEPQIEYRHRISQLSEALGKPTTTTSTASAAADATASIPLKPRGRLSSIIAALGAQQQQHATAGTLALTRRLTDHESAVQMTSPRGLLLHGEVGTGKSMLVDLLADCLPNGKKRRWHFGAFMLEIFDRLEHFRRLQLLRLGSSSSSSSSSSSTFGLGDEHSMLWLAREMISTSPILFLDEFQLPDRAASKILANLMTAFFHLGGVLIATSNRMPEELAKASGVELAPPPLSSRAGGILARGWNIFGQRAAGRSESMFAGQGDFAAFLEVLKARCEVWDMGGGRDWRRREVEDAELLKATEPNPSSLGDGLLPFGATPAREQVSTSQQSSRKSPYHYFIMDPLGDSQAREEAEKRLQTAIAKTLNLDPFSPAATAIPWKPASLQIYGRRVQVPKTLNGTTLWSFAHLCGSALGPADYISLASTFHTFVIVDVPVLTAPLKNEARRFITLLDALYESRCKLLVAAAAGPDALFFPDLAAGKSILERGVVRGAGSDGDVVAAAVDDEDHGDATLAETVSEVYQDRMAPFRPNISAYTSSSSSVSSSPSSISSTSSSSFSLSSSLSSSSSTSPSAQSSRSPSLDFRRADLFTGDDERFAYKRARSRLWELCGRRWWERGIDDDDDDWWRPVRRDVRRWEGGGAFDSGSGSGSGSVLASSSSSAPTAIAPPLQQQQQQSTPISSPFRTSADPPPKIAWVHAWGMMQWGKKAGEWGKGVDGARVKGRPVGKNEGRVEGEAKAKAKAEGEEEAEGKRS